MPGALHIRVTASLLLALFLSFSAARGLFFHTHTDGNILITHSHPFADSTHKHSTVQFASIDVLCSSAMTDDSAQHIELTEPAWSSVIENAEPTAIAAAGYLLSLRDRAPPFEN